MGCVSPARGTLSLRRLVSKLHSISNRQHLRLHVKIAFWITVATLAVGIVATVAAWPVIHDWIK